MKNDTHRYFPMYTDISGWNVLVVGAGKIASRRISTLLTFTDNITVVARDAVDEVLSLYREGRISLQRRSYTHEDLQGRQMVLAATDDAQLNALIARECREGGIPVNVSSDKRLCDFHFPGIVLKDEVTVGVNASGMNHRKAKEIRQLIEEILEDD